MSNTPQIRFAGFTDAWEQRKLGEISESFEYGLNAAATEYDGKHKYIRITDIDDSTHLFIQDNLTSPDIDFSTADDYLLQAGDVLFARTGASVGKTYIYRSSDGDLYFAGFLIRAKIKRDYDADFVFQNTLTDNYDSYIRITSQRSGQPGVNAQEYANFALSVPCLAEQKKIGAYFTNLDNLITLHQRECFSFDFSGESAKTAQKTISWEQRKFSELTEIRSASRVHKDEWQSSGVPFYRSSDVMAALNGTENEKAFISEELYEKLSAVSGKLEKGDVLVTGGGSVGKPYIVPNNEPLYTKDADLLWIKNNENLDPYFVYTFFFSPTFTDYLNSVSHVGTIAHYTITQLGETPITLPCVSEQQKIGDYFRNLDFLITLHQHKPNKKGHDVLSVMPFKGNQRKPHYLCT